LLLALVAALAVASSACTAMLGANDPIEIVTVGSDGGPAADGPESADAADAAEEEAGDAPAPQDGSVIESGQSDAEPDVDAFAPVDSGQLPDAAPAPDAGAPGSDAGGLCSPLANVPASDVPSWQGVTQVLNACSGTQLNTFINDCVTGINGSACSSWQQDPANAPCVSCLLGMRGGAPPDGKGAIVFTVSGQTYGFVNLPGCIDLADPGSNGSNCANALEPSMQCQLFACESCMPNDPNLQNCVQASTAPGAACAMYNDGAQMICAPEYADGGAATTVCSSPLGVFQTICGTGP
jgi:hypothetical protein